MMKGFGRGSGMAGKTERPFRVLEHTADIGFEAFGGSPEEVFANAACALEDLMVPLETIEPREAATIRAEGRDRESLLVNWLSELLYRFDVEGRLFREFQVTALGDQSLEVLARGETFDQSRHPLKVQVKAITYHQVLFERLPEGWHARVYVDI
jgi:protein archease